jgi:hypothetical protein
MKRLILVLTLALSFTTLLNQTTVGSEFQNGLAALFVPKRQLELTTSVIKETSCSPGHLSLGLKFSFRNLGNDRVLLDKLSYVDRTLVSVNLNAASSKKYQQEIRAHLFADSFPTAPTDLSDFAIIQPGEVYDLESVQTRVSLSVSDGAKQSKDHLPPGDYYLQVEVATWTYLSDGKHFRLKWRDEGWLWYEGIISQPMQFSVKQNRPIVKCT